VRPETSPAPLSTKEPANTRFEEDRIRREDGGDTGAHRTFAHHQRAVALIRVVWPTRTPGTSVMAFPNPVGHVADGKSQLSKARCA
jgi:hypothetical protein